MHSESPIQCGWCKKSDLWCQLFQYIMDFDDTVRVGEEVRVIFRERG
jgi:hypothetical protein